MTTKKRKPISKRIRFEVLKRDGMRCKWCGNGPQVSPLVVDHVIPVAKGGTDDPANLVAACVDCNAGKSDVPLEERKLRAAQVTEAQREQAEQIREYLAIQKGIYEAKQDVLETALNKWRVMHGDPLKTFVGSVDKAIKEFGLDRVMEALDIVDRKGLRRELDAMKYFHGVLRRWREGAGAAAPPVEAARPSVDEMLTPERRAARRNAFHDQVFIRDPERIDGDHAESERSQWMAGYRVACIKTSDRIGGLIKFIDLQPREEAFYFDVRSEDLCPGGFSVEFVIRGGDFTIESLYAEFEPLIEFDGWMRPHPELIGEIERIAKSDRNVGLGWRMACEEK